VTTTEPNPHVPVPGETVTDLPAREPHAQARARAREAAAPVSAGVAWAQRAAAGAFSGSSLWNAQPPSLAMYWAKHTASARYFEAGLLRWPRYAWGAVHVVVLVPIYTLGWVTHSIPLLILVTAVVAVAIWLL
jgi:hypothetical protein